MLLNQLALLGGRSTAYGLTAGRLSRRAGMNPHNTVARMLGSPRTYSHQPLPHITIFTGTDCQLCNEAKEVLEEIEAPFTMSTYNIHDDNEHKVEYWRRKYQYDIPVLHLRWDEDSTHFGPGMCLH